MGQTPSTRAQEGTLLGRGGERGYTQGESNRSIGQVGRVFRSEATRKLVGKAQKPPFQYKQLDDLAEKIRQKDITEQKFEEIQTRISLAEEGIVGRTNIKIKSDAHTPLSVKFNASHTY